MKKINILILAGVLLLSVQLFFSCSRKGVKQQPVTPATALKTYLDNGDMTYAYELRSETSLEGTHVYDLLLTFQRWRGIYGCSYLTRRVLTILKDTDHGIPGEI
jgi:glucokinase